MELATRIIKKPRKEYRCYACNGKITGEHLYNVSVIDGDFYYGRFHVACDARIDMMCGKCEYNDDCQANMQDCFYQEYIAKEKTS